MPKIGVFTPVANSFFANAKYSNFLEIQAGEIIILLGLIFLYL